jgi:hypothetical protein
MGHRVRNLSIAQYVSAFSIIILEIVFVILAADPEKRTRCRSKWESCGSYFVYTPGLMTYSGFWGGLYVAIVGLVGLIFSKSSNITLKMINIHLVLNIISSVLSATMFTIDSLTIFVYGHSMAASKHRVLWAKMSMAAVLAVISVILSSSGCWSACCGPNSCCAQGIGQHRCYSEQGNSAKDNQIMRNKEFFEAQKISYINNRNKFSGEHATVHSKNNLIQYHLQKTATSPLPSAPVYLISDPTVY